jgi:hypothetical protein
LHQNDRSPRFSYQNCQKTINFQVLRHKHRKTESADAEQNDEIVDEEIVNAVAALGIRVQTGFLGFFGGFLIGKSVFLGRKMVFLRCFGVFLGVFGFKNGVFGWF